MIPSEMLKLAAEKGVESTALNPKGGDIPTFDDKIFKEGGLDVSHHEKDYEIPTFAEDIDVQGRLDVEMGPQKDYEIPVSLKPDAQESKAEDKQDTESSDAETDNKQADETREKGYKNWDDVPHSVDDESGRSVYELKSGQDSEALNKVPPPPNAIIVVQDANGKGFTRIETDDRGRITKVSRQKIELADKSQRTNETLQTIDKKDGRRDTNGDKLDDGGHLVADEFGGASEETNLVPMDSEVNRHGEWRKMERDIKKELNKKPPSDITNYEVEIYYDDDSQRPSGFTVSYTRVEGRNSVEVTKYISNERPQTEDIRDAA